MLPNFMLKQAMRLGLVSLGKLGISLAELYNIHQMSICLKRSFEESFNVVGVGPCVLV